MFRRVPAQRVPLHGHLHKLHGVRLKLNRAQTHAHALNREIDAWLGQHPYGVFGEYEPGPPEQYVFRVRFLDPIPPEWAIAVGDIVHNARSALDHLAYVVVLDNNGGADERTQFPVTLSPFDWTSQSRGCIGNASARHIELIEGFQPYNRTDLYGWHSFYSSIDDPLAMLTRLSNIDKHSVLHATPAAITHIRYAVVPVRDIKKFSTTEVQDGVLVDGGELLRVAIESKGPNPELKLQRSETVEIGVQYRVDFGKDGYVLQSKSLKETVEAILARLWEIFEVFVGEFR